MGIQELKTTKEQVQEIMALFPETRNNDRLLINTIYAVFHGFELPAGFFDQDVPAPETIRRTRQAVQAAGKYLPTETTVAARRHRRAEFMQFFSKGE